MGEDLAPQRSLLNPRPTPGGGWRRGHRGDAVGTAPRPQRRWIFHPYDILGFERPLGGSWGTSLGCPGRS